MSAMDSLDGMPRSAAQPRMRGEASDAASAARFLRGHALGPADHGDQQAAVEQPLGDAPGVVERDRVDQAVAPLDVVDAEIVELDLQELAGDLGRGVEARARRSP